MLDVIFGGVLLTLTGSVVLLFAMLGELASRVPGPADRLDKSLRPLERARLGAAPATWPVELSILADADPGILLVLSTACASCSDVADQLSSALAQDQGDGVAVLVSTVSTERGERFLKQHALEHAPTFVDEGGEWVRNEFGVMMSPTGLVFREGRLETALVFHNAEALRASVSAGKARAQGR